MHARKCVKMKTFDYMQQNLQFKAFKLSLNTVFDYHEIYTL